MDHSDTNKLTRRKFLKKSAGLTITLSMAGSANALFPGCNSDSNLEYDVVIKGGTVYDGTMTNPVSADIGVKGDMITAIGTIDKPAGKIISANGMIVTPGFIDIHTHCDLTFQRSGMKRYLAYFMPSWKGNHNYITQGVTTVVTGNCGLGYSDLNTWFNMVDSAGFGTNVYHLAPHGMIREELFGKDQPEELTSGQLEKMKARVAEEMEKGAIGLSTGLEYAPGLLASTSEIIELCKVARKYNRLYATHIRNESGELDANGITNAEKYIQEAIEIGRKAEIPVEISHLKISVPLNNKKASLILDLIEGARGQGLDVTADQYPYAAGSTTISILLPNEFKSFNGVKEEFKTADGKKEIKKVIGKVFEYLGPEKTLITMYPGKESYEGKTIKEIAEIEGRSPEDAYADMVCDDEMPVGVFFSQDMSIVCDIMPKDYIITGSDGWTVPKGMTKPHPRVYGTFPKKIREFVLEEKLMDLTLAIRSMTSLPAEKFNMKGRGKIAVGNYADIAVINMKTITDKATYLDPHQYSEGIDTLLVNGIVSIENGKITGERGGKPLRAT
ncbi:MAG: D-aminoacylase [Desulfobacterales bacterium]|nr:D-aminoacylase [Desulfobacterales bacterium]